jgi:hypothetical protein
VRRLSPAVSQRSLSFPFRSLAEQAGFAPLRVCTRVCCALCVLLHAVGMRRLRPLRDRRAVNRAARPLFRFRFTRLIARLGLPPPSRAHALHTPLAAELPLLTPTRHWGSETAAPRCSRMGPLVAPSSSDRSRATGVPHRLTHHHGG